MSAAPELEPRYHAVRIMRNLRMEPDPWQVEVLTGNHRRLLLNCCRQAGKSTVVALLGLLEALFNPMNTVLIVSRSLRQSTELFLKIKFYHKLLGARMKETCNAHELSFTNMSRIVSLPCNEGTIRGFSNVGLLIIDEAARVPDETYNAVRPMLAVSDGRLICLSTPNGKRGFFWEAWAKGGDDWHRIDIDASKCPRIKPEFLAEERRQRGDSYYRQEYFCSFESMEGLVYPDLEGRCLVNALPPHVPDLGKPGRVPGPVGGDGRQLGGIDFGYRNPFAALWGYLDRDDVLWLTSEQYDSGLILAHHAERMPRDVMWYADPSGAEEIAALGAAGFKVRKGCNKQKPGIMAVNARIQDGSLKVLRGRCPHLLMEAGVHRYSDAPDERYAEVPINKDNHALDALRYLVSRLDASKLGRARKPLPERIAERHQREAEEARKEEQANYAWTREEYFRRFGFDEGGLIFMREYPGGPLIPFSDGPGKPEDAPEPPKNEPGSTPASPPAEPGSAA
jgi:hypothetical protein